MMNYKIELFGRSVTFDFDFEAETAIKTLEKLKNKIKESFIVGDNPTEIFYIHDYFYDWDVICWLKKKYGVDNIYSELAIEDVKWTEWRNRDLNGIYYRKYTFNSEVQAAVTEEAERLQSTIKTDLEKYRENKEAEKRQKEKERAELLSDTNWEIKEKIIYDEGGKTHEYIHHITIDNKEYTIIERNVFDFGRVLNLPEGGMYSRTENEVFVEHYIEKNGWERTKVEDPNEAKAAIIVFKYGKFAKSMIRM